MNGHTQHFWEMVYLTTLHARMSTANVGADIMSQIAKEHADAGVKKLQAQITELERIERSKPRDAGS